MLIFESMKKIKIFNDPVYGFITIPENILMEIIEHPYFQRLRRIKQLGMTHFVYPGALHTRFHHALGALHLMQQAIGVLRMKGVEISDEEATGVQIAILLHDIGHGPFSHALEHILIDKHHEVISGYFLEELNSQFQGRLQTAIDIFYDKYPKAFLHQLISGQLDMDRMDYLNRDSFFTGVSEGVIGYDRIIKMLYVVVDNLVVEEKGIYSIEKFLVARRLMYWQVYLHKAVLSAEQMLISSIKRAKYLMLNGEENKLPPETRTIFNDILYYANHKLVDKKAFLDRFASWDDTDIAYALKKFIDSTDPILKLLAEGLVNRKLFKLEWGEPGFKTDHINQIKERILEKYKIKEDELPYLLIQGTEKNQLYTSDKEEIKIINKKGQVKSISSILSAYENNKITTKHYLCYPKQLSLAESE